MIYCYLWRNGQDKPLSEKFFISSLHHIPEVLSFVSIVGGKYFKRSYKRLDITHEGLPVFKEE